VHRILLLSAMFATAVLALACSGGESEPAKKTPEQIAKLEAECIKNAAEVNSAEDLNAIAECMERARQ
jgi:hypothetical protein